MTHPQLLPGSLIRENALLSGEVTHTVIPGGNVATPEPDMSGRM